MLLDHLAKELAVGRLVRMSGAATLVAKDVLNASLARLMLAMSSVRMGHLSLSSAFRLSRHFPYRMRAWS
jgi:hypothetical protein